MFCENVVLEAAAWAVVLHEIGHNKGRRKKEETTKKKRVTKIWINQYITPNHFLRHTVLKVFGRLIV
jgi:hypothetical protein